MLEKGNKMKDLKGIASGIFGVRVHFDQWESWVDGYFSSRELAEARVEELKSEDDMHYAEELHIWEIVLDK